MTEKAGAVGQQSNVGPGVMVWTIKNGVFLLILAIVLFGGSGQIDWVAGWAFFLLIVLFIALDGLVLYRIDPSLLSERSGPQKGSKGWDLPIASLISVWLPMALFLVAALDRRYGWSPAFPLWLQIIGLAATAFGAAVVLWAMATNRYFSAVVRIQHDRGHRVVSTGPYRIVRHPAYATLVFYEAGAAVALGSAWALVPALLIVVLGVVRTALEDRTLQKELPGYAEYAAKVRYMLVPGVW